MNPLNQNEEKSLSLVIPTTDIKGQKNLDQITALLDSIKAGEIDKFCHILVVFDACKENFINKITESYPFIFPIINEKNRLQFARNSNLGLRYAHQVLNTDVILCNQDCILPKWDYLKLLIGNGISTPTSIPWYDGLDLNKAQAPEHKRVSVKEKFPFYCVFINKRVMDEIGYLDGAFCQPTFEDDDYLTRALLKCLTCEKTNVIIFHEGTHIETAGQWESASGSYTSQDLARNLMKYGTKYQVPQDVPHEKMLEWILENHEFTKEMVVQ